MPFEEGDEVLKDKNPNQIKPTELKRLGDTGFRISWKDRHISEYAFSYLRRLCPCAGCSMVRNNGQDVHSLFSRIDVGNPSEIDVKQDICAVEIDLVGRYAVRFRWDDGHNSGIYTFEYLRQICPQSQNEQLNELL